MSSNQTANMEPAKEYDQAKRDPQGSASSMAIDLHRFLEALPGQTVAVLPQSPDFPVVSANHAFLQHAGMPLNQITGRALFTVLSHLPELVETRIRAGLHSVLDTRTPERTSLQETDTVGRPWRLLASPVLDQSGQIAYLIAQAEEVIDPVDLGREHTAQRQSLLVRLLESQRQTSDPDAIMTAAAEAVGRFLLVDRSGFFEIGAGNHAQFQGGWSAGRLLLLQTELPAAGLGLNYLHELRDGRTLSIVDARTHPLTQESQFLETGTAALIHAPILRYGKWHAAFYVDQAEPRAWTAEEVSFVRDVAEQTWDAVERARAVAALKKSEERLNMALATGEGVGAWDWDIPSDLVYCNRRFAELYSVDPARAAAGAPLVDFLNGIHQDDREQVSRRIAAALAAGSDFQTSAKSTASWRTMVRFVGSTPVAALISTSPAGPCGSPVWSLTSRSAAR